MPVKRNGRNLVARSCKIVGNGAWGRRLFEGASIVEERAIVRAAQRRGPVESIQSIAF
jgi:hypothetical protein